MNFVRSRLYIGNLLGQRCRQVTQTWSRRGMCNKPQEVKSEALPTAPAQAPSPSFKIPGVRPSEMDKKILMWFGRFKSADQIPETVSYQMIDAARNKFRVKIAYAMMAFTIGACMMMVFSGKMAARRNESLTLYNMEKKAKWREEAQRQHENETAVPENSH